MSLTVPSALVPDFPLAHHRQLSPTASIKVSPICLGTMNFGGAHKNCLGECNKATTFAILDTFKVFGGNSIDTANSYQDGQSEEWVGEWLAARDCRDEMVIATKYTDAFRLHNPERIQSNFVGNGAKSLKISVELSLKRLLTSYIDILYLHWWDHATGIPEVMHSLNDLVTAGKVLYLGVSDTPAWVVAKANQYARDHGLRQFVVYQGLWNAAIRDFERDIILMAKDEEMALSPYGALGRGKFQTEKGFKEREMDNPGRVGRVKTVYGVVSKVLKELAVAKNTAVTSIALAYVLHKAPYVFPLVGGRKVEHIKSNIEALKIDLSDGEMRKIDRAYPFDHGFPHTFLSGSLQFGDEDDNSEMLRGPGNVWLTNTAGTFDWVEGPKPIRVSEK